MLLESVDEELQNYTCSKTSIKQYVFPMRRFHFSKNLFFRDLGEE